MARSHGRTGRPWLRARARCLAQGLPCCLCGHPIDYALPYRDPYTGRVNRWSATAHHDPPLAQGGRPYDIKPAHLKCNLDYGDGTTPTTAPPRTSRTW